MEFRILGPLEAVDDAGHARLTGGKQKALLALLLLHADRVVPMARLVDDLWGEDVPESAQKMVQIFVSQLRKQMPAGLLETRAPGYLVDLSGHTLDLHRFEQLAERGRTALAQGRASDASELLGAALALWRGPALAEFTEPFARPEADRLEEHHLACTEDRLDAELELGRETEIVGELDALVVRHPHRERLRAQLMIALYRSGRQAEALTAYQTFRRALADDLGIEPSARLKELERQMLQQDPALDPAQPPAPARAADSAARPRTATCPSCGSPVAPDARFCASCGAQLQEAPQQDEMLKLVTVLFADVVDSTARAETLHPEDVRALMTDYFEAMAQELRAEGGTIEKYAGDEIMAVFGVPTAREDDAVHAVRAACRMLERLDAWNVGRDADKRLAIRIGLNTGDVIASSGVSGQLLVAGDAVNVAARLEQAAEAGTILVGERTARAARSHFVFRDLPRALELRGKSATVNAWVVAGERETAEPRSLPGLRAPLVGRERELEALGAAFERVTADAAPALSTLIGDAGIGKSRLVGELLTSLEGKATILIGRCLPSGQGVALAPLAEMLKGQAGVFETDSADVARAKIAQLVRAVVDADLAPDRSRAEAALESTLGLTRADDPLGSLEPRERFREVIAGWRALLASLSRRAPVVAVVEDLHWADPTLLEILDELADGLQGPVFFVCTARPDLIRSRPDWGGGRRNFAALPLDSLSDEESGRLIEHVLDVESLSRQTRRRILARSEGNPFFLEEILRHLIDEGLLVHAGDLWRAQTRIDRVELPDSVQAVILARLDLLSADERRAAQRAAVVGRRFWDGAIADVAGIDDLDGVLRTLRRREFVVERVSSTVAGEREFVFKHVLIRDVAYESLPRAERGRAHLDTAHWIEQTVGDRVGERAEMLAHHYAAAYSYLGGDELRIRARTSLLAASAAAHRRYAIDEGERLARAAVDLSVGRDERREALEALADLHYLSGDAAYRAYHDAFAETSEDDPAYARLAAKTAVFPSRWVGTMQDLPSVDEVNAVIDAGLRVAAPASGDRLLLLVNRAYLMVQREGRRDDAARAAVAEAVAAAEELDDPDLLSAALDLVQAEHSHSGRYGEYYNVALRRVALVPRLTDGREVADAHAMVAWSATHIGRYAEAEKHATACIDRVHGSDAGGYLHGLTWRVAARFMLGDWDGALADQAEIERVARFDQRELPASFTMHAYARAGLCNELRGNSERAVRYLDTALQYLETRKEFEHMTGPMLARPWVALVLARRGRLDEAMAVAAPMPHTGASGYSYAATCEIIAERGAWDEAAATVAAAREEAASDGLLVLPLYADRLEGRAAAAAGEAARADELLLRSAAGFAGLGARWEEAWTRLLRGEVLAQSGLATVEGEISTSLAVFEELGSVREAERARALLSGVAV